MDYGVQFNKLFYERLISNGEITLFHQRCPVCTKHFWPQDKFKELYERAERNTRLRKKGATELQVYGRTQKHRKNLSYKM